MKNVMVVAKKSRKNKQLLAMKNTNKTIIAELSKLSSTIDLSSKYPQIISNVDMDIARNLGLTNIKKY